MFFILIVARLSESQVVKGVDAATSVGVSQCASGWMALDIYRFLIPRCYGILFKGAMKGQV